MFTTPSVQIAPWVQFLQTEDIEAQERRVKEFQAMLADEAPACSSLSLGLVQLFQRTYKDGDSPPLSLVRVLLDAGADPNMIPANGVQGAMHTAAAKNWHRHVALLADRFDHTLLNNDRFSALDQAVTHCAREAAKVLIEFLDTSSTEMTRALIWAIRSVDGRENTCVVTDHVEHKLMRIAGFQIVKLFVDKGVDLNTPFDGIYPLQVALHAPRHLTRYLIRKGADPALTTQTGDTILESMIPLCHRELGYLEELSRSVHIDFDDLKIVKKTCGSFFRSQGAIGRPLELSAIVLGQAYREVDPFMIPELNNMMLEYLTRMDIILPVFDAHVASLGTHEEPTCTSRRIFKVVSRHTTAAVTATTTTTTATATTTATTAAAATAIAGLSIASDEPVEKEEENTEEKTRPDDPPEAVLVLIRQVWDAVVAHSNALHATYRLGTPKQDPSVVFRQGDQVHSENKDGESIDSRIVVCRAENGTWFGGIFLNKLTDSTNWCEGTNNAIFRQTSRQTKPTMLFPCVHPRHGFRSGIQTQLIGDTFEFGLAGQLHISLKNRKASTTPWAWSHPAFVPVPIPGSLFEMDQTVPQHSSKWFLGGKRHCDIVEHFVFSLEHSLISYGDDITNHFGLYKTFTATCW